MLQLIENQPSICSDSLILTYVISLSGYKEKALLGLVFTIFTSLSSITGKRRTLKGMKS